MEDMECSFTPKAGQLVEEIQELRNLLKQLTGQESASTGKGVTTRSASRNEHTKLFASIQKTFQVMETKHEELLKCQQKQKDLAKEFKEARNQMTVLEQKLNECKESAKSNQSTPNRPVLFDAHLEETPSKKRRL